MREEQLFQIIINKMEKLNIPLTKNNLYSVTWLIAESLKAFPLWDEGFGNRVTRVLAKNFDYKPEERATN